MSKENKTFELKDEDLEEVNGGFSKQCGIYTFDAGDCFECTLNNVVKQIKVKYPYINVSQNTSIICDQRKIQNGAPLSVREVMYSAYDEEFNKNNFIGNNKFDF